MIDSNSICIAYETVENADGTLPLLTPMSEVAGRMAAQQGAKFLEKHQKGCGILLGGVPGVSPAKAVVIGGGVVGTQSAKNAFGSRCRCDNIRHKPRKTSRVGRYHAKKC